MPGTEHLGGANAGCCSPGKRCLRLDPSNNDLMLFGDKLMEARIQEYQMHIYNIFRIGRVRLGGNRPWDLENQNFEQRIRESENPQRFHGDQHWTGVRTPVLPVSHCSLSQFASGRIHGLLSEFDSSAACVRQCACSSVRPSPHGAEESDSGRPRYRLR